MTQTLKIEMVSDPAKALKDQDALIRKVEELSKSHEKAGRASIKAAQGAEGSFAKLEQELKDNLNALKRMEVGTKQFDEQKRKVADLTRELGKARSEMSATEPEAESLSSVIAGGKAQFALAAGAALAFAAALGKVAERAKEARESAAAQAVEVDTLVKRLQIQAGLEDKAANVKGLELLQLAKARGVTKEVAFGVETQAKSSGFQEGVTEQFIKAIQATNFAGPEDEFVKATSQFLKASGKALTVGNTRDLLVDVQSLFKDTDLQAVDLSAFAKVAKVLTDAGLNQEESLATLVSLREILPADQAAIATRNFITSLETASINKPARDALAQAGVDPKNVDFVGESFQDVLVTLDTALSKLTQDQSNIVKAQIFGKENLAAAGALIESAGGIAINIAKQNNEKQFDRDADVAALSKQAITNRVLINKDIRALGESGDAAFKLNNQVALWEDSVDASVAAIQANKDFTDSGKAARIALVKTSEAFVGAASELGVPGREITSFPLPLLPGLDRLFGSPRKAVDEQQNALEKEIPKEQREHNDAALKAVQEQLELAKRQLAAMEKLAESQTGQSNPRAPLPLPVAQPVPASAIR